MKKWGLGLACGLISTGLILTMFGRSLFPEFSLTFRIIWLLITGTLVGAGSGILLQMITSVFYGILWSGSLGILGFYLIAMIFSLDMLTTTFIGAIVGVITGIIVQIWGETPAQTTEDPDA